MIPANDIFVGVNRDRLQRLPRLPTGIHPNVQNLANLGTKAGVEGRRFQIHTPLIKFSKAEIIHKAVELGVDLSTHTQLLRSDAGKVSPAANAIPAF